MLSRSRKAKGRVLQNKVREILLESFEELEPDDITRLELQVHNGYEDYECEGGFFWGHQFQEEAVQENKANDLDFIERAKEAFKTEGSKVVYSCWY